MSHMQVELSQPPVRLKRSENGFTLIEVMLVLFTVSVLSVVTVMNFLPVYKQKQIDHFFQMFEADILFTQSYAMTHDKPVSVYIYPENYVIKETGFGQIVLTRPINKDITIEKLTLPNPFTFFANGNIQKPGKLLISYQGRQFVITFLLGKGRFYVEEL